MTTGTQKMRPAGLEGLTAYLPEPALHDEALAPDGTVRPLWTRLFDTLRALGPRECANRTERLNRLVRENGIAHDVFADPDASEPPWRVDFMPLLISAAEWQTLEAAIDQRARLFNAILADVYGPQTLMRSGQVPPELVFEDPSFLRPCHGVTPKHGHVQFHAADLARGPGGTWHIIDSHTETLAGIGLALANRVAHTHIAGDVFRACNGLRLAPFFEELSSALARETGRDDPLIALLTPGPHHGDYFSHAYLARYLGYHLVEGEDLRVGGGRVFLKTLEGLKQVDRIVRCVEGGYSDPLELDPGGFLGPVGLMQAVRRAPNLVANVPGSALAENRGLGPFLPHLAETILGEQLELHDAPRWWLGDEAARQRVLADLDAYVIRPAHEGPARPGRARLGMAAGSLDAGQRQALRRDVEMHVQRWWPNRA